MRAVVALALLVSACGGGLSGTYSGKDTGFLDEMTFRSGGEVDLTFMGMTKVGQWKLDGDRVTITIGGETNVLTRGDDGCLDGGGLIGRYCRGASTAGSRDRGLSGTWQTGNGQDGIILRFASDGSVDVTVREAGSQPETRQARYDQDGDQVTIRTPDGDAMELVRRGDVLESSTTGATIRFTRK
jgi:hypothetical protein